MVLLLNFALYLYTFLFAYRKEKLSLYTFLLFEYVLISFMGIYTYYWGIYQNIFGFKDVNNLSFLPYLLCYIFFIIYFKPLSRVKLKDFNVPKTAFIKKCVNIWFIFIILYIGLKLSESLIALNTGLGQMYEDRHMEGDVLFDYSGNVLLRRINTIGAILINTTIPFVIVYCISNIRNKSANFITYIMMISCFIPQLLQGISFGSRGMMFGLLIRISFIYILIKDFLPEKVKKYALIYGLLFTFVMLFYSLMITNERFGDNQNAFDGIARYFGECFPNLGFLFWDHVKEHPMGDRLFPDLLGVDLSRYWFSVDSMYNYWWSKTGVPVLNFKTLFGDMYIEFDVLGAFIFVILMNRIMNRITKTKYVPYYNITYCAIYFQIGAMGFAGLTQIGGFNNVLMLFMIIINTSLYLYDKKFRKQIS